MAQVKAAAMRDMTVDEIQIRMGELTEEIFNLRFRNSMKQLDNPLKIRLARREMARLKTVLHQKAPDAPAMPVTAPARAAAARATRSAKAAKPAKGARATATRSSAKETARA
jgi:large subunit ribosomal protein L29